MRSRLLRGLLHAGVLQPVRDPVLPVDEDGVIRTGLLAFAAAGAVLLDHADHAEEAVRVLHVHHLQGLERAALDALLAAGARLLVHESDRALVLLQHVLHVAVLVEDGVHRADRPAGAAVDAQLRPDDVQPLALARDRVGGTPLHAGRAADAGLDDAKRHGRSSIQAIGRASNRRPVTDTYSHTVSPPPPTGEGARVAEEAIGIVRVVIAADATHAVDEHQALAVHDVECLRVRIGIF